VPADMISVQVFCQLGDVNVDQIYLNASTNSF
jgi:hypothetical protein